MVHPKVPGSLPCTIYYAKTLCRFPENSIFVAEPERLTPHCPAGREHLREILKKKKKIRQKPVMHWPTSCEWHLALLRCEMSHGRGEMFRLCEKFLMQGDVRRWPQSLVITATFFFSVTMQTRDFIGLDQYHFHGVEFLFSGRCNDAAFDIMTQWSKVKLFLTFTITFLSKICVTPFRRNHNFRVIPRNRNRRWLNFINFKGPVCKF